MPHNHTKGGSRCCKPAQGSAPKFTIGLGNCGLSLSAVHYIEHTIEHIKCSIPRLRGYRQHVTSILQSQSKGRGAGHSDEATDVASAVIDSSLRVSGLGFRVSGSGTTTTESSS